MKSPFRSFLWVVVIGGASLITLSTPSTALTMGPASLFVGPASGIFTVGSTFTVSLYLNTGGQAVNAVEANLYFSPNLLQVVSPTAGKSLIQVWINQPTYSNVDGTLKFQGAIPSPGINTDSGVISTLTFRVRSIGTAIIKISDSSHVLLNDGRGTDILGQTTNGVYSLVLPPPAGPIVTSPTHPDQDKWYRLNDVSFRWVAPPDIEGYSYILNTTPVDEPPDISAGTKTAVTYKNLADGEYYFHIKSLRQGEWGGVTNYRVGIDTTPPAAFQINISPGDYTSNPRPIIEFTTTDVMSGVDHYELKFVPLDPIDSTSSEGGNSTPFFIETSSPYSQHLTLGRYEVIVRAYDKAGNSYEATTRLTITTPLFEIIRDQGLRIGGAYTVSWPYVGVTAVVILVFLTYAARYIWRLHFEVEERLGLGVHTHPAISDKLQLLKNKQSEYKKNLVLWGLIFLVGLSVLFHPFRARAEDNFLSNVALEPPVVTLFPKSLSNDEILYAGGRATQGGAEVTLYLQNVESGSTVSQTVTTDKTGAWFYSYPQFLTAGHYLFWTQLKAGDVKSPPGSRMELTVAPTAIQIGENRLTYQDFYLILLVIFLGAFLGLLGFSLYHGYHFRVKNRKLLEEIWKAEESIRRGFLLVRNDIEAELALVRKAKLRKELSLEEKLREEKLLKDLDMVTRFVGKEVWEIERTEKEL